MTRPSISPSLLIYLIRHGQTVYNRERRFNGRTDSPLTDLGVQEARRNGRALQRLIDDVPDVRIVSSPLGRAVHTAQIVSAELGVDPADIATDTRLTEISFGAWEGLTIDEIEENYPGEWDRRHANMWTYAVPRGESYEMVARRVDGWLSEARGQLVVVTHGAVDRVLRGLYAALPEQEICALDEPQDVVFKLAGGTVTRI